MAMGLIFVVIALLVVLNSGWLNRKGVLDFAGGTVENADRCEWTGARHP